MRWQEKAIKQMDSSVFLLQPDIVAASETCYTKDSHPRERRFSYEAESNDIQHSVRS